MLMRWWLLWAGLAAGCPTSSFTVSSGGGIGGQAAFGLPSNDAVSTGRGVNVVLLDGVTHELLSTHTFDTYGDGAASDAFVATVLSAPAAAVLLVAVEDEASNALSATARTALATCCGATLFNELSFRQSYAAVLSNGATAAHAEQRSAGEGGVVEVSADVDCEQAPPAPPVPPPAPPAPPSPPTPSPPPVSPPPPSSPALFDDEQCPPSDGRCCAVCRPAARNPRLAAAVRQLVWD